jgi:hypothetical protein
MAKSGISRAPQFGRGRGGFSGRGRGRGGGGGQARGQQSGRGGQASNQSPPAHNPAATSAPKSAGKSRNRPPRDKRLAQRLAAAAVPASSQTTSSAAAQQQHQASPHDHAQSFLAVPGGTPSGGAAQTSTERDRHLEKAVRRVVEAQLDESAGTRGGSGSAKGIVLAFNSVCNVFGVVMKQRTSRGRNERVALFFNEDWYHEFQEIHQDPMKYAMTFPGLVHRFKQYLKDSSLSNNVRTSERPSAYVVHFDNLYTAELLALMCFIHFGNGIHGRTYGDFLIAAHLQTDVLLSCDKVFLDNSREGRPNGFFDDTNYACVASAAHSPREDRVQWIHDVTGLRTTSLGVSKKSAEGLWSFLAAGFKGRVACRVCNSFKHEKVCVPVDDLNSEVL